MCGCQALATRQQEEDEALEAAPDDFLDPLLGTFMHDPVLLPTSGQTVDRTTIARHILRCGAQSRDWNDAEISFHSGPSGNTNSEDVVIHVFVKVARNCVPSPEGILFFKPEKCLRSCASTVETGSP